MTNQLSSKTKRNIGIAAAAILTSALVIPTAIAARDYQEKLTQCEKVETRILESLDIQLKTALVIKDKLASVKNMKDSANENGIIGWMYYGPKMEEELKQIKPLQNGLDNLTDSTLETFEIYNSGVGCKLSEEYRKEQWMLKIKPAVDEIQTVSGSIG